MRCFALIATSLLIVGCDDQSPLPVLPPAIPKSTPVAAKTPLESLRTIPMFAFGGVYEDGRISEGETSFQTIFTNNNAKELFQSLLTNSTPEGKLYALCGVRKLTPAEFNNYAATLDTNAIVRTMTGCIVLEQSAGKVLARVRSGYYDPQLPVK